VKFIILSVQKDEDPSRQRQKAPQDYSSPEHGVTSWNVSAGYTGVSEKSVKTVRFNQKVKNVQNC